MKLFIRCQLLLVLCLSFTGFSLAKSDYMPGDKVRFLSFYNHSKKLEADQKNEHYDLGFMNYAEVIEIDEANNIALVEGWVGIGQKGTFEMDLDRLFHQTDQIFEYKQGDEVAFLRWGRRGPIYKRELIEIFSNNVVKLKNMGTGYYSVTRDSITHEVECLADVCRGHFVQNDLYTGAVLEVFANGIVVVDAIGEKEKKYVELSSLVRIESLERKPRAECLVYLGDGFKRPTYEDKTFTKEVIELLGHKRRQYKVTSNVLEADYILNDFTSCRGANGLRGYPDSCEGIIKFGFDPVNDSKDTIVKREVDSTFLFSIASFEGVAKKAIQKLPRCPNR